MEKVYLVSKAMLMQPFSVCLSGNFLNVMRQALSESGFKGYPVYVLTGKPNKGKTSVYEACVPSDDNILSAPMYDTRSLKKEIAARHGAYAILDDIAKLNSNSGAQGLKNMADKFIRVGFTGDVILAGLTAEEDALKEIKGSANERVLVLNVNKLWNEETMQITEEMYDNREGLGVFRPDEIWFAQKDTDQATQLYPLSDFNIHKTANIENGYLNGRYGGIPFLSNLKDLHW